MCLDLEQVGLIYFEVKLSSVCLVCVCLKKGYGNQIQCKLQAKVKVLRPSSDLLPSLAYSCLTLSLPELHKEQIKSFVVLLQKVFRGVKYNKVLKGTKLIYMLLDGGEMWLLKLWPTCDSNCVSSNNNTIKRCYGERC